MAETIEVTGKIRWNTLILARKKGGKSRRSIGINDGKQTYIAIAWDNRDRDGDDMITACEPYEKGMEVTIRGEKHHRKVDNFSKMCYEIVVQSIEAAGDSPADVPADEMPEQEMDTGIPF